MQLADDAAETIRALNHATFPAAHGLARPSDIYDVLASLSLMAARLPQLLDQLDTFVTDLVDAGRVSTDAGDYTDDPEAAAAAASWWLDSARAAASQLSHHLDQAQQSVAFMTDTHGHDHHDHHDRDDRDDRDDGRSSLTTPPALT